MIRFDLGAILKPNEVTQFEKSATLAGAGSLTEHFLNITLRLPTEASIPRQLEDAR